MNCENCSLIIPPDNDFCHVHESARTHVASHLPKELKDLSTFNSEEQMKHMANQLRAECQVPIYAEGVPNIYIGSIEHLDKLAKVNMIERIRRVYVKNPVPDAIRSQVAVINGGGMTNYPLFNAMLHSAYRKYCKYTYTLMPLFTGWAIDFVMDLVYVTPTEHWLRLVELVEQWGVAGAPAHLLAPKLDQYYKVDTWETDRTIEELEKLDIGEVKR